MNIALVAPASRIINVYPPLGLGIIAAILIQEGHRVKIFDFSLKTHGIRKDSETILLDRPDVIGISAMVNNYQQGLDLAKAVKSRKNIPVVLGGPHPTLFADEILSDEAVDFVIRGEGEDSFRALISCFNNKTNDYRNIQGLSYRSDDRIIHNQLGEFIPDLDALPYPERKLFGNYMLKSVQNKKMATIITSRGCPFNCSFCYKGLFGKKFRARSPESVIDEIKRVIADFGIRSFYFVDDLFMLDKQRVTDICHLILREKLDITFQCLSRVDTITPDLLSMMKAAGCEKINYGIESADETILNRIGKTTDIREVEIALKMTREANILTKGYFMLGLPGDTEATIAKTLAFAGKSHLDETMFSVTVPFPGTELWEMMKDKMNKEMFPSMYYYNFYEPIPPIINLSDISDDRLMYYIRKANRISLIKKYGRNMGNIIFLASASRASRVGLRFFYRWYNYRFEGAE
ncbi:MAG: radical SAM protein [Smithella sp.]|nr:radical SAM protein [Smithella sp.]